MTIKHLTEWREFDNGTQRIRVEYGLTKLGDQSPHFAITAEIGRRQARRGRWCAAAFGCLHDEVREHFPDLAPLIRWHLCAVDDGPLHYVANAQYWAEITLGLTAPSQPRLLDFAEPNFMSTVVFGAVEGDEVPWANWCHGQHGSDCGACERTREEVGMVRDNLGVTRLAAMRSVFRLTLAAHIRAWCDARYGALMSAFRRALRDHDVYRDAETAPPSTTLSP
jgi:hypothetical protein